MKKILTFALILTLLVPTLSTAQYASPTPTQAQQFIEENTSPGVMTIKSFKWLPQIFEENGNKLLKADVDFHYEGDFITLGEDYYFNISCRMNRQKRRGGYKTLYEEERDLSILDDEDLEIEGPKDFAVTFTFTFFPSEFEAAKKRGVLCDISPSGDYGKGGNGYTVTKFPEGMKTYGIRVRPKSGSWVVK
ncbi:hypothetical protein HYW83_02665 [Candidatus Peregrinibacteria bacterium]|nr:hypothetical protein [Candidatus Peregrinibacteria bacterium]